MREHHRRVRDARLIGIDNAPLPPGEGGPLTVQGVGGRPTHCARCEGHATCGINQLSTQKNEALLYTTSDSGYHARGLGIESPLAYTYFTLHNAWCVCVWGGGGYIPRSPLLDPRLINMYTYNIALKYIFFL